jgi:hypothetical protein
MMGEGFDAIHAMLQEEGRLLEERSAILAQMQQTLTEHACDYNADLEDDDYEVPGEDDPPPAALIDIRPKTAPKPKPRRP